MKQMGDCKNIVLSIFTKLDQDGCGSVPKEGLEQFLRSTLPATDLSELEALMKAYTNPSTGGIDYVRFVDWVFKSDQLNACPAPTTNGKKPRSIRPAPLLAPSLQKMLVTDKTEVADKEPVAKSRPPVVLMNAADLKKSRLAKRRPKPLPVVKVAAGPMEAPVLPPTITGREIAEAPPVAQVAATADADFKAMIKEPGTSTGAVLEHFTSQISEDIFGLPFSLSVAIPTLEDTPLIAISDGFTKLTGYSREEIVGRNCRFLLEGVPKEEIQAQTRLESRRYCRAAHLRGLTKLSHTFLIQRNCRKNGEGFWNLFMLAWVPGPDNSAFIVGLQLDLGPNLDLAEGEDIMKAVEPHEEHLRITQKLLFGQKLGAQISLVPEEEDPTSAKSRVSKLMSGLALSEDIKQWISQAESSSDLFVDWGTLPWTVWPGGTKYALVKGGTSMIRLEANEIASGGVAMSIFPMKKSSRGCSFKVSIDEVCSFEPDVSKGGWLPSIGFTEVTPATMDEMGGLPSLIESTAKSVCLRGDGRVFVRKEDGNWADGDAACAEVMSAEVVSAYVVKAGDVLECFWKAGSLEVTVLCDDENTVVYRAKDKAIPKPPKKPLYALMDCCHAACKLTLLV